MDFKSFLCTKFYKSGHNSLFAGAAKLKAKHRLCIMNTLLLTHEHTDTNANYT